MATTTHPANGQTIRFALYKNRTYRIMRFAQNNTRVQLAFQDNLATRFWVDTSKIREVKPGETIESEAIEVAPPTPPANPQPPAQTVSQNPLYLCLVEFGSNYCEVTNQQTQGKCSVPLGATSDLSKLSDQERGLMLFLLDPNADAEVNLRKSALRLFKELADRLNKEQEAREQQQAQEQAVVEQESQISNNMEDEIKRLEYLCRHLKSCSEDKTELVRIVYYIPSLVSRSVEAGGKGKFANLAGRMRAHGLIQFDGSTYCGKVSCVPTEVFEEMEQWNRQEDVAATQFLPKSRRLLVRYKCERIHPDQLEATRNEAFEQLRDHVVEIHLSLMESVDSASKRLDETLAKLEESEEGCTGKQLEAAHKRRIGNVAAAISAAKARLADAIKAAQLFDETESLEPLFKGLRQAIMANNSALIALKRAQA